MTLQGSLEVALRSTLALLLHNSGVVSWPTRSLTGRLETLLVRAGAAAFHCVRSDAATAAPFIVSHVRRQLVYSPAAPEASVRAGVAFHLLSTRAAAVRWGYHQCDPIYNDQLYVNI